MERASAVLVGFFLRIYVCCGCRRGVGVAPRCWLMFVLCFVILFLVSCGFPYVILSPMALWLVFVVGVLVCSASLGFCFAGVERHDRIFDSSLFFQL